MDRPVRILIVTQWFDPEPTSRGLLFARALRHRGNDVHVVTGFPNYPDGVLYPGYRLKAWQRERVDGVNVLRVPLYPSHDRTGWRRALNYASFAAATALLAPLLVRRPDVVYVYHPPLTTAVAGAAISALMRAPFVLDIQDLWPDTLTATGMVHDRRLLDLVDWLCGWVYRRAGRVVVQSEGFALALRARGVPPAKLGVIYNWADEAALAEDTGTGRSPLDPVCFNVVFAGTMGKAQGLDTILEAAERLLESAPTVRMVLVGGGVERDDLERMAGTRGLRNVAFLPRMAMDEVGTVLRAADVLLVHLRDDPLFAMTIPSKTQAYLAVGRPILMAVRGESAGLIDSVGAGVTCPPEDPVALAEAIEQMAGLPTEALEAMGRVGRDFYESHLSLDVGVDRFVEIFTALARRGPNAEDRS
jgi:glycosyltransferase involved in cell wall biosynthesis